MTDETTYHQFKLRMPLDLKNRLQAAADAENRSLSAEILYRIEASFAPSPLESTLAVASATESLILASQVQQPGGKADSAQAELLRFVERARTAVVDVHVTQSALTAALNAYAQEIRKNDEAIAKFVQRQKDKDDELLQATQTAIAKLASNPGKKKRDESN